MITIEASKAVEARAEEKVKAWRATRGDTKALKNEILTQIRTQTFNSAVLMRLLAELLVAEGNTIEALAAFDTYVVDQKLQFLKRRTGASASVDALEGTQHIFELVLTMLEGEAVFGDPRIEKLRRQLLEICDESDHERDELNRVYAGIYARTALALAIAAVDDDTFTKYMDEARAKFAVADAARETNVESVFARSQFLALTAGPAEAFPLLKAALVESPDHIRLALLFVQILSAESKTEEALRITEMYLNKDLVPRSLLDKMALIELKKTHVALLELVRGPEAALNELPEFVEMVSFLFRATSEQESARNGGAAGQTDANGQPHSWGRIFPFRRRETLESIASSTSTPARESSQKLVFSCEREIVGSAWFWIAEQYARAGLEAEARESIDEARKFESAGYELFYTARMQTILGQIESQSNPRRALEHYLLALDAEPLHFPAAIGIALLLNSKPEIFDGEQTQQARNVLTILEASCARYPGRYIPDAWYARGALYESLGGRNDARDMYWKTVQLEERRGVSRYVFLEPALRPRTA